MTTEIEKKSGVFIPGSKANVVPFMRDVFTIPSSSRERPRLIGSQCKECEEYFFPKTGAKATCDNPFCPRSTGEVLLSGRGKLLSATVTRSHEGQERASAVIMLEEGIKINSALVDWEGFRDLLVPGTPVELVLQEMEVRETGETVVGYGFRMVTGRRKPRFLPPPPPPAPPARKGAARAALSAAKPDAAARAADGKPAPIPAPAVQAAAPKKAAAPKAPPKPAPKKAAAKKAAPKKPAKKAVKKAARKPVKAKAPLRRKPAKAKSVPRGARGKAAKKAARPKPKALVRKKAARSAPRKRR